ncbi:uncharacterized protein LOC5507938 isoform X3 [Nematostella vectensis]|uniref:uncharacterized protein LOC5507938 isoform X3 n=1 Tax=Nematostella vectensis TaxID=45351 RepID=UPI002076FE6A|nr:uncharacterized protein LOC5507938 isoform X3 [Nematostella vectensis]
MQYCAVLTQYFLKVLQRGLQRKKKIPGHVGLHKSSSSLAAEMTPEQREMGREVAQNTPKRPSSVKCPKCGKDESHLKRHMARRHGWSAKHYNKWVRQVRMQANKDKRRVVKCPVKACNWARAAP